MRPSATSSVEAIVRALTDHTALSAVDADAVLLVALSAHGDAIASVRPFGGVAARVTVDGHRRTVELGLRPRFFLEGDAMSRLTVLAHELLHVDGDGLRDDNRHSTKSQSALDKEARAVAKATLKRCPPALFACLAHHGELTVRAWRRRPCEALRRSRFDDSDVFESIEVMHTMADRRSGWW